MEINLLTFLWEHCCPLAASSAGVEDAAGCNVLPWCSASSRLPLTASGPFPGCCGGRTSMQDAPESLMHHDTSWKWWQDNLFQVFGLVWGGPQWLLWHWHPWVKHKQPQGGLWPSLQGRNNFSKAAGRGWLPNNAGHCAGSPGEHTLWGQGRAPREMLSGKDSSVSAGLGKARGTQGLQIRGFIVLVLALKYF